ncbi:MAG: hypothetical protein AAF466_04980 [Bacteroidota bacterium]
MSRSILLSLVFVFGISVSSAQESIVSEDQLIGCWQLSDNKNSNGLATYVPCKEEEKTKVITFNSYGEYRIYIPSYGRCGTNAVQSYGRYVFSSKKQVLKLIDRPKQRTLTWKVIDQGNDGIAFDKNYEDGSDRAEE